MRGAHIDLYFSGISRIIGKLTGSVHKLSPKLSPAAETFGEGLSLGDRALL
jgi:hypothetical protein